MHEKKCFTLLVYAVIVFKVKICQENLEMSGNLTPVTELTAVKNVRKNIVVEKLFIINLTFGAMPVFSCGLVCLFKENKCVVQCYSLII